MKPIICLKPSTPQGGFPSLRYPPSLLYSLLGAQVLTWSSFTFLPESLWIFLYRAGYRIAFLSASSLFSARVSPYLDIFLMCLGRGELSILLFHHLDLRLERGCSSEVLIVSLLCVPPVFPVPCCFQCHCCYCWIFCLGKKDGKCSAFRMPCLTTPQLQGEGDDWGRARIIVVFAMSCIIRFIGATAVMEVGK